MKFLSCLSAIGLATVSSLSSYAYSSEQCEGGACTTISVMVAYTQEAEAAISNGKKVTCSSITGNAKVVDIYDGLSIVGSDGNSVPVTHPCQPNGENGDFIAANNQTNNYMKNVANIGIAELNTIFADSGLGRVTFELAGEPYSLGSYEEQSWYTPLASQEEGEPTQGYCGLIDYSTDCVARFVASQAPIAGEMVKARNYYNAPEAMQALSKERVKRHADIVVLLVSDRYETGGIAAEIGVQDKKNGYVALRADWANAPAFTFSHEVSHLFGAGHVELMKTQLIENFDYADIRMDPIASDGTVTNRGIVVPNDGVTCAGVDSESTARRTIMVYDDYCKNCLPVPFISNPNVKLEAEGGAYDLGSNKCNNAEIVNRFADRIASFGEALEPIEELDEASKTQRMVKTYSIDFGFDTYRFSSYTTVSQYWGYWNNLTNPNEGAEIELKNQLGQSSTPRTQIKVVNGFYGRSAQDTLTSALADFGLDEMPPMAIADGFSSMFPFNPGVFKISGLNPNVTYSFKLFAGGANVTWNQFETFKFSGETHFQKEVVAKSSPNFMNFVEVSGIKPTQGGDIFIRVESGITNNGRSIGSFFSTTNINALEFWPDGV